MPGIEHLNKELFESLRDRFACAALTGMLANSRTPPTIESEEYAEGAYKLADAMLKVRVQP
jgi:hypothetical protein